MTVVKWFVFIHLVGAWAAFAQAPATSPAGDPAGRARDPLATRQQIVRDRMTQLEDRMFRLTEQLSRTEPEQARKMEAAIKRAQELLIRRHMGDAIQLLEEGKLTDAGERQIAVMKGLEGVLKILLEEGDNTRQRAEEMDRLREYRARVQRLLENERELKTRVDAAPRLARMLAGIQAAIARLEALIEKQQKEVEAASAAVQGAEADTGGKLAQAQNAVRRETEELGKRLEDPANAADPPEGEGRPQATPGKPTPAGGPADQPEARSPGGDRQSGDKAAGKDAADKGANDQPTPEQAAEGKSEAPGNEATIEAGMRQAREDVNQAAGQMHSAENALDKQAIPEALPMQKKALESLRRALRELRKQEQETRRQLDQAEAARRQRELQKQAADLAERMKNGQAGDAKEGGQPGGQQSGQQQGGPQQQGEQGEQGEQKAQRPQPPAPGNHNVEQAEQHMRKAVEELEKNKPRQASPEQQRAIEQLEQAQRELEQALDQLRREQQEEILRGLESRFRAMLARQTLINEGTLGLDKKGRQAWDRTDELKLAGLAQDQAGVADQAGQALNILKEEGTTVVFPRIVEQMREDMSQVASLLHDRQTGARTQRIQSDIVTTLKELIGAIRQLRDQLQSGQAGGNDSGQQKNPPLLPSSAELKLLRTCQERVNRQTQDFHAEHADAPEAEARRALEQIARRQQEVAELARKMHERITGQ